MHKPKPAEQLLPPEAYARVFVNIPEGAQILEELARKFGSNPYVRGGHEADRETAFRAGRNDVVNFITGRIHSASYPDDGQHANDHD